MHQKNTAMNAIKVRVGVRPFKMPQNEISSYLRQQRQQMFFLYVFTDPSVAVL